MGHPDRGGDEHPRYGLAGVLVAALVHAGDAVVPAEALVVEEGPEEADAQRTGGEECREDAAAHRGPGGGVVGEGEEEELVDQRKNGQGCGGGYGRELEWHLGVCCAGKFAEGDGEGGGKGDEGGQDDAAVDDAGHETQVKGGGLGGEDGVELGLGGFDDRRGCGLGSEEDGGPLGRGGLDGGGAGYLCGLSLEDAELRGLGGRVGVFAEGALGEAGAGFTGGYELTGELDEVCGDLDGRAGGLVEDGRLANGDLLVEGETFGFVEGLVRAGGVGGCEGLGGVARDLFIEANSERLSGGGGGGFGCDLIEFEEELVLGFGNGLGLADGALGLFGEEGAIALGLGVAFGDGGGDLGSTAFRVRGLGDGGYGGACGAGAASAVGGEAFGYLLLEGKGCGGCFRFAEGLVQ